MSQNLVLDPTKKDYVVENGAPIGSDRVLEASYYALLIPQNNWLYGTTGQGSLLYTLANQRRVSSIEQQFATYATEALKRQVIDKGIGTADQVANESVSRMGSSNKIEVIPAAVQVSTQLNFSAV